MEFDFASIWTPWVIFGVATSVIVTIIIILTIMEKIIDTKIRRRREEEEMFFKQKIAYLKSKENVPEQFLISFNEVALEVFREILGLKKNADYEDIIELFNKRKKFKAARFAEEIQEALYSGKKIDKEYLDSLLDKLVKLINDFREYNAKKSKDFGKKKKDNFEAYAKKFLEKIEGLKSESEKIDAIKRSIENKKKEFMENIERTLKVSPLKRETIKHRKVRIPKRDSKKHEKIRSLDDLDRIKGKIKLRETHLK